MDFCKRVLFCVIAFISVPNALAKNCADDNRPETNSRILAGSWGSQLNNNRFQSGELAGLNAADVPRLKLKWAYYLPPRFPGTSELRSQPAVTADTLYLGTQQGDVLALDSKSGCTRWIYNNDSIPVRTAITLGKVERLEAPLLFFGDDKGFVTALDARTGRKLWKTQVDTHPEALITGAITLYKDRLYVSVSSLEVVTAMNPMYNCCTFRGSVARLDALSGNKVWQTFTTPEPQKTAKNALGVQMWGPSGAPIWNSPTIDTKRNLLYVGTGENYSSPASQGSDSVLALDLDSGALRWAQQLTTGDAWNMSCTAPGKLNCPKEDGFDLDVGANTILQHLTDGRDLVIAGQKAGWVWALDPDQAGKPAWKTKVGRGGALGGIHWGMGSDERFIYAPNSDYELNFLGIVDAKRPDGKKSPV